MKKNVKLSLNELTVKSFVPTTNPESIKGGTDSLDTYRICTHQGICPTILCYTEQVAC